MNMPVSRLAAIQYRPPLDDPASARLELTELVSDAASRGARLVVAPELAVTSYVWTSAREIAPFAERPDGPTYQALAPIALRYGAWIVVGIAEQGEDGFYNSALMIDSDGQIAACYRKVLLFDADRTWARRGKERVIARTPFGSVMPAVCMDLNDDRLALQLHRAQPDILAFPTNWLDQGHEVLPYWRYRLFGWRGVMVAANKWGDDHDLTFSGRSAILSGEGHLYALARQRGDEVLIADVPVRSISSLTRV